MLYIRTDMNNTIATGHVMRCLSIADAAKQLGEGVTFLLADNQAEKLIQKRGFHTIILNTKWDDMESELSVLENIIFENKIEKILIDSYQVTENYLERLSELTKTIYIDDLNAFVYPVHAIICYANYWEKFKYAERYSNTKLLLGTDYIPLRKEFSACLPKQIKDKVENLLLLSGGTDNYNILDNLLQSIDLNKYRCINVICGKYYNNFESLSAKYSAYENVRLYKGVDHIEKFMEEADLAVSAGGTTLYELCAMGVPTISYSFADNQLDNVKQFQEDGIIDYAGDIRTGNVYFNVKRLIIKYCESIELRQSQSLKMQQMVDGGGAECVIKSLAVL